MKPNGTNGTMTTATDFLCPFCNGRAGATVNPPAVVHALPMCDTFAKLEPADYLAAVNQALGFRH